MKQHRSLLAACVLLAFAMPVAAEALEWEASAGLGYDSNAFRTPDSPYTDFAAGGTPVTPNVQSGLFVPLAFSVGATDRPEGLFYSFSGQGELYLDSSLSNANNHTLDLNVGSKRLLNQEGNLRDTLSFGLNLTRRSKVFYDRDTGIEKTASDRYSYTGLGLEGDLNHRTGTVQYGIDGLVEARNYDAVPGSDYDYNIYKVGGYTGFRLSQPTKLRLDLDVMVKDYSERKARDLTGAFSTVVRQDRYTTFDAAFRHRLNEAWVGYLDYRARLRQDNHQGYDDYLSHRLRLRLIRKQGALSTRLEADHEIRSYDNALAFNTVGQPGLDYTVTNFGLTAEYARSEHQSLWAEFGWHSVHTNDTRYEYDRAKTMAGMRWTF